MVIKKLKLAVGANPRKSAESDKHDSSGPCLFRINFRERVADLVSQLVLLPKLPEAAESFDKVITVLIKKFISKLPGKLRKAKLIS